MGKKTRGKCSLSGYINGLAGWEKVQEPVTATNDKMPIAAYPDICSNVRKMVHLKKDLAVFHKTKYRPAIKLGSIFLGAT